MRAWKLAAAAFLMVGLVPAASPVAEDHYPKDRWIKEGIITVIDGDTLLLDGMPFHLHGLDAPEPGQPCTVDGQIHDCGEIAANVVRNRAEGLLGRCFAGGHYARVDGKQFADCAVLQLDGTIIENLTVKLLDEGWAFAAPETAEDHHLRWEAYARDHRLGFHATDVMEPWRWREANDVVEPWIAGGDPNHVQDGDSIIMQGERIRLFGIDAPELDQTCTRPNGAAWDCGDVARLHLRKAFTTAKNDGAAIYCVAAGDAIDRYGRRLAICKAGDRDLNADMVLSGYALAYRQYSTAYVGEEETAAARGAGIWGSSFITPWEWRKGGV